MPCIDTVQGFYFFRRRISHAQAFTAAFLPSMQLYSLNAKTVYGALQVRFRQFDPFHRIQYQTGKRGYNTACTALEHITAPQHLQRVPDTRYHTERCTGQRSRPIIIRYIRVQRCAPVIDPCQTVQHIANHASPAMCRYFPRLAAGVLAWVSLALCFFLARRRGTLDGYRRISFRAFAR